MRRALSDMIRERFPFITKEESVTIAFNVIDSAKRIHEQNQTNKQEQNKDKQNENFTRRRGSC